MKKLFCILLSCILVFNSVSLVYADADSTSRSSFNPYEQFKKNHPDWFDSNGNYIPSGNSCLSTVIAPALIRAGETSGEIVSSLADSVVDIIKGFNNSNGDVSVSYDDKGVPVTAENYNENNFYLTYNNNFCNYFNQKVQDSVHVLDGYYLLDPENVYSDEYWKKACNVSDKLFSFVKTNTAKQICHVAKSQNYYYYWTENTFLYLIDGNVCLYIKSTKEKDTSFTSYCASENPFVHNDYRVDRGNFTSRSFDKFKVDFIKYGYGNPLKVFYSFTDLTNYLSKGRVYAPKLPSGGLKVPITYIQNNVNLPDLNINLDSLIGKAEANIQADIDLALKNYFDSLLEINNNPTQPAKPTPTPDGGFTDGTTPTPTPPITDGGDDSGNDKTDLSKITDLLQKILDKLTEFSSNHDTLAKTITDYIEKNDGKLDEIIVAINALADGKTEEEKNGCKYDFTALSEFMTTLWNESDKKFDKMVELLEENNKYQQKLVNSLNEIKALLVTQTIMDLFKDRSSETANKAKDKFPTSIPWDIALVLNSMSAEPEQLKFSLPIKIDSFKINETIDIDLSSDEWEKLATTCRYILSITFILFLIHLSRKLFSNGGDE